MDPNVDENECARRLVSDVYEYVKCRVESTPNGKNKQKKWKCTECTKLDKNHEWTTQSTSNFRVHLQKHHPVQYTAKSNKRRAEDGDDGRVTSQRAVFTQHQNDEATEALVAWIVIDAQPFMVVEQDYFKAFCEKLEPDYQLPTRKTVRKKIISRWDTEKENLATVLRREISGNSRVSLTTDMWTSAAQRGYMVVTLHYISPEWIPRAVIIGFVRVPYPHTGSRLADSLIRVVTDVDERLLDSLWMITADNASNNMTMVSTVNRRLEARAAEALMNRLMEEAGDDAADLEATTAAQIPTNRVLQLRCTAHVIQLAVKEGLKQCPLVDSSIGALRDVVKKVSDSPKLVEAFESVCYALGTDAMKLDLDVETRWNSTWIMLDKLIRMRRPLDELLRRISDRHEGYTDFSIKWDDHMLARVNTDVWASAEMFRTFLKPFQEATLLMSGSSYPTLSMIAPVLRLIRGRALASIPTMTDPTTIKFATAVQRKLNEYDALTVFREVKIALALDPRYKAHLNGFGVDSTDIRVLMREEFENEYAPRAVRPPQASQRTQLREEVADTDDVEDFPILLGLLEDVAAAQPEVPHEEPFSVELERWLNSPGMSISSSSRKVCNWFKLHGALYPRIEMMAREYLGVAATSVPSEMAFSKAGCTIRDRRARLGDDAVRAICELQSIIGFNNTAVPSPLV